jgi:hypothetical protein
LLNFASEAATHHAGETGNRTLQAYIGELISGEYDLRKHGGPIQTIARDFFLGSEEANETLTSLTTNAD